MKLMIVKCSYCGKNVEKTNSHVNRANKLGSKMYCNKICFGLDSRDNKSEEQKKKDKAEYDRQYREKNKERIKIIKQEYCKTTAGRAMQKRRRDKSKEQHKAYIKSDKYKAYKKEYDQKYRAKKNYGEFWESSILLNEIEKTILPEVLESRIHRGLYNKSQKRKRIWKRQQQNLLQKI